ncbi:MAG TPA: YfhO family protein, partial [Thermomicrobiales bacterium]|nr:YfhO family protein [Thermomicrobiales bacterium]
DGSEVAFIRGSREFMAATPPVDGMEPEVTVTHSSPDHLTLDVSHSGQGLLVVSEVYSESWQATVDGEEVPVYQTNHALLGIPVGPGDHTVEISYAPETLAAGLWISGLAGAGSLGALGYAGWAFLSRRRGAADVSAGYPRMVR